MSAALTANLLISNVSNEKKFHILLSLAVHSLMVCGEKINSLSAPYTKRNNDTEKV